MQKFPIRKNIIIVILFGYVAVLGIFATLACIQPETAFGAVEGPLMALIGGSLAIAKDLIDSPLPDKQIENLQDKNPQTGQEDQ